MTYEELESKCQWLEAENGKLKADVENLAWNLGGCSTFALGYDMDKPWQPDLVDALPALREVRELREKYDKLKEAVRWADSTLGGEIKRLCLDVRKSNYQGDREVAEFVMKVLEDE